MSSVNYYSDDMQPVPPRFGGIFSKDGYVNAFYILTMFAISIVVFVYVVTGLALSIGLGITIFGLPLAYLYFKSIPYIMKGLTAYTSYFTGYDISRVISPKHGGNMFKETLALAKDKYIQRSLGLLVLLLPLSIFAFVSVVALFSLSIGLIGTLSYPVLKYIVDANGIEGVFCSGLFYLPEWGHYILAFTMPFLGVPLLIFSLRSASAIAKYYAEQFHKLNYSTHTIN